MTKCNDKNEQRRHNTGLAKVAVQCSADTFVVHQSFGSPHQSRSFGMVKSPPIANLQNVMHNKKRKT